MYPYKWLGRIWKPKYPEGYGYGEGECKLCEICGKPICNENEFYCRWGLIVTNGFGKPSLICGHRECLRKRRKGGAS